MKILAVCQSGLGSSFMVQMNIQQILSDEKVDEEIQVDHADVGSVTADAADYFFVETTLKSALGSLPEDKIILLDSLIDQDEIREKVNEMLDKNNIQHG
ncbi:PTS sugar transporter subunit IIB [Pediococcus acidilactici]|jgi:PTS system ascorbate-specific IIB component|uniref:PTS sugar transporter subunit IIB n=1 Tax=Pediococcus acidilactici TaxID=1254 RepID=A0AAW8YJJ1_PEDAC|nr:PTS sugar transporter subunit IIB [Pediococcus acidilactici]GAC45984.1 PTS system, ascorbate-specific IIB component [Pediococcus acidilactici NGRI 0510Q]KAF0498435.1 PTS lactose transporter subunit IIB [Pediococcus acidilactici]KRN90038.1 PTS system, ascorbate-specific IIB component [Pediococcus acidilactici]MCH9266504.1 PTS sugar transporter subunit IIB [Pediococcus acidilactici]MCI1277296.1 PTS sugar transporter subunit IIB [Pediococcus acidilactici]